MRKLSFFLILLNSFCFCIAQSNYKAGYLVKLSGDTTRGEIDYRNWDVNPKSISFKVNNVITEFTVKDILAFSIDGEDVYKKCVVTYQLNTLNTLKADVEYNEDKITDTVFLRQLVKGKYNLYELITIKRPYYFIEVTPNSILELVSRVKKSEDNRVTEDKQYKDLLLAYAMKEGFFGKLQTKVGNMSYQSSSLVGVVGMLNGESNIDLTITEKKKKVNFLEIGAGLVSTFYSSSGPSNVGFSTIMINSASFNSSVRPAFEVAMMLGSKRQFSKARVGFQLGYSSSVFDGSSNSNGSNGIVKQEYHHEFNLLRFSLIVSYIFNPLDKYQFYIDPSISVYNVLGKNLNGTTIETYTGGWQNVRNDYPSFSKNFVSFGTGIGVVNGSHRLELKGDYSSNNGAVSIASTTIIRSVRLSLGYHYSIFRF